MILYLYKIGTDTPVLTVENAQSYTADGILAQMGRYTRRWRRAMSCPARRTARKRCGRNTARQSHTGDPFGGTGGTGGGASVRR